MSTSLWHAFTRSGRHFLVSGRTGRWREIGPPVAAVLSSLNHRVTHPALPSLLRHRLGDKEGLLAFARLHALLPPDEKETHVSPPAAHAGLVRAVHLTLTEQCPLACAYCPGRDVPVSQRRRMPPRLADQAIALLATQLTESRCRVGTVDLTPAVGEPLAEPALLQHVLSTCRAISQQSDLRLTVSLITNGVLLDNETAGWLREHEVRGGISIDGPPDVHDALRTLRDGRGSYSQTLRGLRAAQRAGLLEVACVTLTPRFPYPFEIITHLLQLGLRRIVMKPVRALPDSLLALTPAAVSQLKTGYSSLAAALVEQGRQHRLDAISAILNRGDFFGRFLLRIALGERVGKRCHAGLTDIAIAPDGGLSACSNVAQTRKRFLGNLRAPPFLGGEATGLSRPVTSLAYCRDCWARLFCGGPCLALLQGQDGRSDTWHPQQAECELTRHLVELAMWLCSELSDNAGEPLRTLIDLHQQRLSRAVPFAGRELHSGPNRVVSP